MSINKEKEAERQEIQVYAERGTYGRPVRLEVTVVDLKSSF